MKKLILVLSLLPITLVSSAQTFVSNNMSRYSAQFERIDFYNEGGTAIVSLAPRFYKLSARANQDRIKERIKPIEIDGQTYFIKLGKNGVQSVYDDSGEHVANMERNGEKIQIIQDGITTYSIRPRIGFVNPSTLQCMNSEGTLVSEVTFNSDRRLEYKNIDEKDPNLLLMSLCIHKYQELLLRDRGRQVYQSATLF